MLTIGLTALFFDPFEEVWVIAHFTQLHQHVVEWLHYTGGSKQCLHLQHLLVEFQLHSRETNTDIDLDFLRQFSRSVGLCTAEHERFEDSVQDLDYEEFGLLT